MLAIEDCQVCCRQNALYVRIDEDTLDVEIDTDYQEQIVSLMSTRNRFLKVWLSVPVFFKYTYKPTK